MTAYACNPRYLGGTDKGITVQGQPGQKFLTPYLKKNKIKTNLGALA
jgi:hypothetical protein